MNDKYLTVSTVNKYLKYKIDTDKELQNVYLKGEISNCKIHTTGHIYFSIKDETSKINAIMFSSSAKKLSFNPVDGTKVLIHGRISIYEATGNYQIYVDSMEEDGLGNLYIAFEKLKKQLSLEGLFDEKYKKAIPKYPSKIGVITANTGAAIRDIVSTIKRRYPIAQIILFPSLVQGDNAASDIVKNINLANTYEIDVLIVGRGGGSIEDLWPFNEEIVARAIFNSKIPIISGVGHEIDYTIADFVSDLRAPTPTGAAELSVPDKKDLEKLLDNYEKRLKENILKKFSFKKMYLESLKNSYIIKNPHILYENKKQKIDLILEKLNKEMLNKIADNKILLANISDKLRLLTPINIIKNKNDSVNLILNNINKLMFNKLNSYNKELDNIIDKLNLVNPLNTLKRGYTLTYKNNKTIKSIKNININDELQIRFNDGYIKTIVKEIKNEI